MENIRIKITIRLNGNHALNIAELAALKPIIERGVAACLPDSIAVDTVRVTRIKDADAVLHVERLQGLMQTEGLLSEPQAQCDAAQMPHFSSKYDNLGQAFTYEIGSNRCRIGGQPFGCTNVASDKLSPR